MFSEKKKKSKGWLIFIPFLIIFIFGLWLNVFMDDSDQELTDSEDAAVYSQQGNDSNEIPIYEYDNNDGDVELDQDQGKTGDDVSGKQDDTDETKVVGLADYFMVISENDEVKVKQYKDGILIEDTATDIEINALPQYDRDSLDRGIVLLTQEEVDMLLENYEG